MTAIEKLERRKVGLQVMKTENFIALIWNANKICNSENCPIYSRCESCNPGDICFPHKLIWNKFIPLLLTCLESLWILGRLCVSDFTSSLFTPCFLN